MRTPDEGFQKMAAALAKAQEWGNRIPVGVFYQNEHVSTYQERLAERIANYLEVPPAKQAICNAEGKPVTSIRKMLKELRVT